MTFISEVPIIACMLFSYCRICAGSYRQRLCKHGDYTTINEMVFSCRESHVMTIASAEVNTQHCKCLDCARVGRGHVTSVLRSNVTHPQCVTSQQCKERDHVTWFLRVRSRVYRRDWSSFTVNSWFRVRVISQVKWSSKLVIEEVSPLLCEDLKSDWKTFFVCNIWSDLKR
jgi:hypothetical protein